MDTWDMAGTGTANDNESIRSISPGSAPRPVTSMTGGRIGSSMMRAQSSTTMGNAKSAFTEDTLMEYIPDLEEVQEEDLTMAVASAPEYKIHHITSLKELDADLMQSKPFSTVDGVSLKKLCKFIVPERFLVENDEFWDWENIYTEIAADFRKPLRRPVPQKMKEVTTLDRHDLDGLKAP